MTDQNPCAGYAQGMARDDCCDAHRGYRLCGCPGPTFGTGNERARCGAQKGHDGPHVRIRLLCHHSRAMVTRQ